MDNILRKDRDELTLAASREIGAAVLLKLCNQWLTEDSPQRTPEDDGTYLSDLDWDEHGNPIVVPLGQPEIMPADAAVRLSVLMDYVNRDGSVAPILSRKWHSTLSQIKAICIECFKQRAFDLDWEELRQLKECFLCVKDYLAKKPKQIRQTRRAIQPRPLTKIQAETIHIVGEHKGNIAESAKKLGKNYHTVKDAYDEGIKKLGKGATKKPSTQALPYDARGQVNIVNNDDKRRD